MGTPVLLFMYLWNSSVRARISQWRPSQWGRNITVRQLAKNRRPRPFLNVAVDFESAKSVLAVLP